MARVRKMLRKHATTNPIILSGILGVSNTSTYDGIKREEIGAIRIGNRLVIPVAPLEQRLGLGPGGLDPIIDRLEAEIAEKKAKKKSEEAEDARAAKKPEETEEVEETEDAA